MSFEIKRVLDKTKPYGQVIGITHNGAAFAQDGIEFNAAGKRVTRLAPEEERAEKAFALLEEEETKAKAAKEEAAQAVLDSKKEDEEHAETISPNVPKKGMPDFHNGWTRAALLDHAWKKFNVRLPSNATHPILVKKCEALY